MQLTGDEQDDTKHDLRGVLWVLQASSSAHPEVGDGPENIAKPTRKQGADYETIGVSLERKPDHVMCDTDSMIKGPQRTVLLVARDMTSARILQQIRSFRIPNSPASAKMNATIQPVVTIPNQTSHPTRVCLRR
jgi:hypothetical protein